MKKLKTLPKEHCPKRKAQRLSPCSSRVFFYSDSDLLIIKQYNLAKRARSINARFSSDSISRHDLLTILKRFEYKCFYCGKYLTPKKLHIDHFHPKANGGKNVSDNLVPACDWCNKCKGALDGFAFVKLCQRVSNKCFLIINKVVI